MTNLFYQVYNLFYGKLFCYDVFMLNILKECEKCFSLNVL